MCIHIIFHSIPDVNDLSNSRIHSWCLLVFLNGDALLRWITGCFIWCRYWALLCGIFLLIQTSYYGLTYTFKTIHLIGQTSYIKTALHTTSFYLVNYIPIFLLHHSSCSQSVTLKLTLSNACFSFGKQCLFPIVRL